MIIEAVAAMAACGAVSMLSAPKLSTAALKRKGTHTFSTFPPPSRPNEIRTLRFVASSSFGQM
jgi:hypothetical protein